MSHFTRLESPSRTSSPTLARSTGVVRRTLRVKPLEIVFRRRVNIRLFTAFGHDWLSEQPRCCVRTLIIDLCATFCAGHSGAFTGRPTVHPADVVPFGRGTKLVGHGESIFLPHQAAKTCARASEGTC